ncbi:MAG: hypothetical protein HC780_20020 [Leptolyngbyaceae cyanobacterium CSU_1_3]|nr:hypothetical protein [Leptolyngbyaceae cyanobacterium CSU_1_3]
MRRRQPISKGFSVGLQIWLLFLISLYWLGYPAEMSIVLGAIGGLASGLIVDWWLSKDEKTEPDKQKIPDEGLPDQTKVRKRRNQNSALRQRSKKRKQQASPGWRFFGKKS